MNQTVLPKLQTIEAELASQESQLAAQLASVQEKLSGIRAVMPMFSQAFSETADSAARPVAEELAVPAAPESIETEVTEVTEATEPKKTAQKKATAQKKTAVKKASAKEASTEKTDGRTAAWQMYTRPGVKNESIPDAVRLILATQPENDFKIVDVMEALFQAEMPESQYLKARNRISNVLSGGVRAGDWHKGDRGTYRMTAA